MPDRPRERRVVTHPRTVAVRTAEARTRGLPNLDTGSIDPFAVKALMRAQIRLSARYLIVTVSMLFALPLILVHIDTLTKRSIGGVPLAWPLIAAGYFPAFIAVGRRYTTSVERLEAQFAKMVDPA